MLFGLLSPSPLPSAAYPAHVPGMNCIGPTARSHVVSPSYLPPSVSWMAAKPWPLSTGPRMDGLALPFASTLPPRAWLDSMRPMLASSDHSMWQPGLVSASRSSAFMYASSITPGMPSCPSGRSSNGFRPPVSDPRSSGSARNSAFSSSASGSLPPAPSSSSEPPRVRIALSTSPGPGACAEMSERPATSTQSKPPVPVSSAGVSIAQVTVAAIPHWRGVSVPEPATTLLALRLRPRFFGTATNTHSLSLIAPHRNRPGEAHHALPRRPPCLIDIAVSREAVTQVAQLCPTNRR